MRERCLEIWIDCDRCITFKWSKIVLVNKSSFIGCSNRITATQRTQHNTIIWFQHKCLLRTHDALHTKCEFFFYLHKSMRSICHIRTTTYSIILSAGTTIDKIFLYIYKTTNKAKREREWKDEVKKTAMMFSLKVTNLFMKMKWNGNCTWSSNVRARARVSTKSKYLYTTIFCIVSHYSCGSLAKRHMALSRRVFYPLWLRLCAHHRLECLSILRCLVSISLSEI